MGLAKALLEAIHGEDERISGRALTKLTAPLSASEATVMYVESTQGFGEYTDGANDARLLINGEIITALGRTSIPGNMTFLTLTRAVDSTDAVAHPEGSIVYDISENKSAIDLVRRGLFLRFAQADDLDVIGRNLGLHKCPGLDQETWRRFIKAVAYLPKQPLRAYEKVLEAYFNDTTSWDVYERPNNLFTVTVEIDAVIASNVRGRFVLGGSEEVATTGLTAVSVSQPISSVFRVVKATIDTRRGRRYGLTNYYSGGGSFVGSAITLGSSPGAIGTRVIVDYQATNGAYHYLAPDELTRDDSDRFAYLTDPTATIRCLLNQVRAAGSSIEIKIRS